MIAVLYATSAGVGISPDSVTYIGVARNLVKGNGLTLAHLPPTGGKGVPMIHFPPFFPMILAIAGIPGGDPLDGARWLNSILFGADILLVGILIQSCIRTHSWISIVGSILVMSSVPMLTIHSLVWSEPLFIFLGLLGLGLMAIYLCNHKAYFLVASSCAVGLAFLCRYTGASLVATGLVAITLLDDRTIRVRFTRAAVFIVLSCLPMAIWLLRNLMVTGHLQSRQTVFHPITVDHVRSALSTLSKWLMPEKIPETVRICLLLAALAFLLLIYWRARRQTGSALLRNRSLATTPTLLAIFVFLYLLVIVGSISFLDAATQLDDRILSPVLAPALVVSLLLLHDIFHAQGNMWARIGLVAAILLLMGFCLTDATRWVGRTHQDGQGYASRRWRQSEIVDMIRQTPSQIPIFTNGPDALYILTGRPARMVPGKIDPTTGQPEKDYLSNLAEMRQQLEEEDGVLVLFHSIDWRWYLPTESELAEQIPLQLVMRDYEGVMYRYDIHGG